MLVASLVASSCDREPPRPGSGSGSAASCDPFGHNLVDVARRVQPSVVSVLSAEPTGDADADGMTPVQVSLGSGVILAADGIILTSNHVVDGARKIYVGTQDGRHFEARMVGNDPPTDMAVLRIDARGLPAIKVADSARLEIGQPVLAVGTPFGLGQTVTMGIVSGLGRASLGLSAYDDFIQTDAAINPGNSGGALVDMTGGLVGINTAILSRSGGYEGIGFAVPSSTALGVAHELISYGKVTRGWLGLDLQDLGAPRVPSLQLASGSGVVVAQVEPDSPAAIAGLHRGDIIVGVDHTSAVTAAQVRNALTLYRPGSVVTLKVRRGKQVVDIRVRLGDEHAARPSS